MPPRIKTPSFLLPLLIIMFLLSLTMVGCGGETSTSGATGGGSTVKEKTAAADEDGAEALAIGQAGSNTSAEISVEKVGVTNNLDSPEAAALLMTGEAGEQTSYYGAKGVPAAGYEFLMVTLKFKNINAKPPKVTPSDLELKDEVGKEYEEVSTGGYGGVFNMNQVEPGKEATVTAVYEVPKGVTGLTLTYEPYGTDAVVMKVR